MAIKAKGTIILSRERNVKSVHIFYYLSSSSTAPSAPTEAQGKAFIANNASLPTGWLLQEPQIDVQKYLYSCTLTAYTDGNVAWSLVSKSSSYEGAKSAYNKAINATNVANGKANIYVTDGTNTPVDYKINDIWVNTQHEYDEDDETVDIEHKNIYLCVNNYSSSYKETDWELVGTDDSALLQLQQRLAEQLQNIHTIINQIQQDTSSDSSSIELSLSQMQTQLSSLHDNFTQSWTDLGSFMAFKRDESNRPNLVLGTDDSDFNLVITNDKLIFRKDDSPFAYFSGDSLYVVNSIAFGSQGSFQFVQRPSNGHFTLRFLEPNSGGNN